MGLDQVAHQGTETLKMENELKTIIATNSVPAELIVTYDDMHGLWGGTMIMVHGDGNVERQTREIGAPEATIARMQIDERKLIELVQLLVELQAWEQRIADEPPIADESRAQVAITLKEDASRVWERVNEMVANNRLIQLKTLLENL